MHRIRSAAVASLGVLALTAALFASPAGANDDRDGDADRDVSTAYNEDNDTNDGGTMNNVVDDTDNAHPSGDDRSVENGGSGTQGKSESDPDDDGRGPDRSNDGPDKPNGSGGEDLADQDGNNGCGNDDDFEDDNEGWCGKPEKPASETDAAGVETECKEGAGMSADANDRCGHSNECAKAGHMSDDDDAKTCDDDDDDSTCTDAAAMTDEDDDDEVCVLAAGVVADAELVVTDIAGSFGGGIEMAGGSAVLSASLEAPTPEIDSGVLSSVSAGALAFTGDHIMLMTIAALLAVVAGTVMVRQTRRTKIEA